MSELFDKIKAKLNVYAKHFNEGFKLGSGKYKQAMQSVELSASNEYLLATAMVGVFSILTANPYPLMAMLFIPVAERFVLPAVAGLFQGVKQLIESLSSSTSDNAFAPDAAAASRRPQADVYHIHQPGFGLATMRRPSPPTKSQDHANRETPSATDTVINRTL